MISHRCNGLDVGNCCPAAITRAIHGCRDNIQQAFVGGLNEESMKAATRPIANLGIDALCIPAMTDTRSNDDGHPRSAATQVVFFSIRVSVMRQEQARVSAIKLGCAVMPR